MTSSEHNAAAPFLLELHAAPAGERRRRLVDLVAERTREILLALLPDAPDRIDPALGFRDLGLDSFGAVDLRDQLTEDVGRPLPVTIAFDHPTPAAVADFLMAELFGDADGADEVRAVVASDEPIAIVGIGCRYPAGINTPEDLWRFVVDGRESLTPFPTDRGWDLDQLFDDNPDAVNTSYAREGHFLHNASEFDPDFFGINPREAVAMDPQQRLVLETAWEAVERAGIDPRSLRGSQTGVFIGAEPQDYGPRLHEAPAEVEGYLVTGNAPSVVSGRVAYVFGLQGPTFTVDTACSASLVALHLACQALRTGETGLALAGGVTMMSTPGTYTAFSRQRAIAPDGRCKAFAASADGTGFSEGAGILLLERLSDAQRNGHPVVAVIRGSAINQDGASSGLTAPNGVAQERLIRQALANAGLTAADVDAVEAHGTGTRLGDPIEAHALMGTYGRDRGERPDLRLGSIKSNIGHTQAAAGSAGVIKMVMAMRHGVLPRTLHVDEPSPYIDWSRGGVRLLTENVPWDKESGPRRAGVSSFGVSGTNAHVILEEAPATLPASSQPWDGPVPVVVSGRTEQALRAQAEQLAAQLAGHVGDVSLVDLAYSSLITRSQWEHRAVVVADDRAELVAGLTALGAGESAANVVPGTAQAADAGPVFVFPGQGSQWVGMAVELLDSSPAFAERFRECAAAVEQFVDWSVEDAVRGVPGAASLERIEVVQPVLFAVMVSLAALWESVGVRPAAVVGHSQGEVAAACIAGGLSVVDAACLVVLRSRLFARELVGKGGVVAVALGADELTDVLTPWANRLSIGGMNGPRSSTVVGEPDALAELVKWCESREIRARLIASTVASHCAQVDPLHDELVDMLAWIDPRSGGVPFYSTVTGELVDTSELGPEYWFDNARRPVNFRGVIERLAAAGHRVFVEVSPHPVLTVGVEDTLAAAGVDGVVVGTLRRDEGGLKRFLLSAAGLHVGGVAVDWGIDGNQVELPTYAFQRERYWLDVVATVGDVASAGLISAEHPLLGAALAFADSDGVALSGRLSLRSHPWLADHAANGQILFPGTGFVEIAVRAGDQVGCGFLEELTLEAPLPLPETGGVQLQVLVGAPDDSGRRPVSVHSRADDEQPWTRHATGFVAVDGASEAFTLAEWPPADAQAFDLTGFYEGLATQGYGYGPAFQGVRAAWRRGDEIFAEVALPEKIDAGAFGLHPALLDASLHAESLLNNGTEGVSLPFAWSGFALHAAGAAALRVRLWAPSSDTVSLQLADSSGTAVATVESLVSRPIAPATQPAARADSLYRVDWVPASVDAPFPGRAASLGADDAEGADVVFVNFEAASDVLGAAHADAHRALELAQSWDGDGKLVFVTTGAVAAGATDEVPDLAHAPLWGLIRTAQTENPDRFVLLDLDSADAPMDTVLAAIGAGEPQLAVRDGVVLAPRLARAATSESLLPPAGVAEWRLHSAKKESLSDLELVPWPQAAAPLAPGEVRVAIRAAGLNFRDVVVALGMVPENDEPIGGEVAGVVLEVASDVTDLAPGDRVMGLLDGAFGPVGVTDRRLLARMPEDWSFTRAASLPVVYLTAYYGLMELGRLRAGESVLIHAAAGGVGMAAVQLARHLGAEVYGTASPVKWGVLRGLGLDDEHIASSRTLEFAEKFGGVDVVLNSLSGEFTDASLRLLSPGGRFLEMGKTDQRDPGELPGVEYIVYSLMEAGPDRLRDMLATVLALLEQGAVHPLPVRAWDVRRARDAFRFMSRAKHIGKVVLTMPSALDPAGTVLISGSGTLGGIVARHLVTAHGVRNLVFASRGGGSADVADELTELGASVTTRACDIADREALARLLAEIPSLTGVVHTAGVLDDGTLGSLTPDRIDTTFRPKVDAAWQLHELTRDKDLAMFVLYSSAAGILGDAGQGNYAAANTFLDALAAHRRAEGLPASSLAWGFWAQRSEMSAHLGDADVARMEGAGSRGISAQEGMALFDRARVVDEPLLVPIPLNTANMRDVPALLRGLVRSPARRIVDASATPAAGSALEQRLAALPATEQDRVLVTLVRTQAAAVLGHADPGAVDAVRAFRDLGFDSLTAVELRNRLNAATGLRLPATVVFDHPNATELARLLKAKVLGAVTAAEPPVPAVRAADDDPIVIVAMSCRYPGGVESPEDLWRLVVDGGDAISAFPANRGWDLAGLYHPDPANPGTSYSNEGGFLHDADEFDAAFFGISPREALATDPQQRLTLEAAWQVLERAGIDPRSLRGSSTGVFVGATATGYAEGRSTLPDGVEGYLTTGVSTSVISGRVAYVLGLEGPAVTVDTACSSSLVTIHLAAESLRRGDSTLAIAGGVTVLSTPELFVEFSRQRGLAADGRCKAYSDSADGTGFAEGAGMVLLERLSDAERNGHPVLAVVRGSAINQDGASNGLSAPSGPAQQRVIRRALAAAGLSASDVDIVEGHGTGTTLGDPIEAQALLETYGQGRADGQPLWLGTVKSNIGHSQCAAGVAGVIKMVMALRHEVLPRTLHAEPRSSHVDWTAGAIELLTENHRWDKDSGPRRVGVSSFGISGTNAHIILEQAPPTRTPDAVEFGGPLPVVVSARSEAALRAQAARLLELDRPNPADLAYSLATTRSAFEHRAVVLADDLTRGLTALAEGATSSDVIRGEVSDGKLAFLFTGQGSQRLGMGRALYDVFPAYTKKFDEVTALLEPSTRAVMFGDDAELLHQTVHAQAALFAVEVSLFALLESWGVRPDYLVGHSIGEIAAAHVAGVLSLPDACRLVSARGRLMQALPGGGAMIAVQATEEQVLPLLSDGVSIAAVNGPSAVVVSGDDDAAEAVATHFADLGHKTRRLKVSHAFHSPRMEPMLAEFREVAESLSYQAPSIPIVSTLGDGDVAEAEYWVRQVRGAVRFLDAVRHLDVEGVTTFLELGPDGVLSAMAQDCLDGGNRAFVPLLRKDRDEVHAAVSALASAFARGVAVDWDGVFAGGRRIDLPTYAFQRENFWLTAGGAVGDASGLGQQAVGHPLLGAAVTLPDSGGAVLTGRFSVSNQPWLADHVILDTILFPGTGFIELALRAGDQVGCESIEELTLEAPLVLTAHEAVDVHVTVDAADDSGRRPMSVYSRTSYGPWTRHATGVLTTRDRTADFSLAEWPPAEATPIDVDDLYDRMTSEGVGYGPSFRGLRAAWRRGEEVFAEVELPAQAADDAGRFGVHPALLDAALHTVELDGNAEAGQPQLPFAWSDITLHATGAAKVRVRMVRTETEAASLQLADVTGAPVAEVGALVMRPVSADRLNAGKAVPNDSLFLVEWTGVPTDDAQQDVFVFGEEEGLLLTALRSAGVAAKSTVDAQNMTLLDVGQADTAKELTRRTLAFLQSWLRDEDSPVLGVVTSAAVAARPEDALVDPAHAALWGLVRAAQEENHGRLRLIDVDGSDASYRALPAALAGDEPQLALREGEALVPRLIRTSDVETLATPDAPWRLDITAQGTLDNLALVECDTADRNLAPGEVRIAVRAAGVNFRDVLISLGMYPGKPELGCEAAGVVVAVGPEVAEFAPGDEVLGLFDGGFGPYAVADRRMVVAKPKRLTFAEAASVPAVFATAYYGLVDLTGLRAGEKVLVHAAAGGVGMAAVQLATHLGAEVFGTASRGKWSVLSGLGIDEDHIASSRDVEFVTRFAEVTGGSGVDVVLNSLAREFVDASLDLLPRGGRFAEMGKTDVREAGEVARDHAGVDYRAFDLSDAGPDRTKEILTELVGLIERGVLTPLPLRTWDVRKAPDAFRYLAQARHVGKVVLTVPNADPIRGAVLVTGGTGGLGSLVARHLVTEHGVRDLVLTSRRGIDAPGAQQLTDELAELGARVRVVACDVSDRDALAAVIDGVDLRAVVHTAGVVDDGVFGSLTDEQLDRVWDPKADAARHLHELTRHRDLDAFVLFSSSAGTLDGAGQGNYAAANAFLDGVAARRRASGLPAVSLAWGMWAPETGGMTSKLADVDIQRLNRSGVLPLSGQRGLALLDESFARPEPTLVPIRLDLAALRSRPEGTQAILRGLVGKAVRRTASAATADTELTLEQRLGSLTRTGRERLLTDLVCDHVAAVLGHTSRAALDPNRPFKELGFDSLTAVELRNRLSTVADVRLPATLIFDHPTPAAVADLMRTELMGEDEPELSPIEAELARLESIVDEAASGGALPDDAARQRIAARLRALAANWGEQFGPANGKSERGDIAAATAEDLFDILDSELETFN
ncbi:type I polyketide synthase [Kutzneria sp. CA-103260]|uniref:type I polyketide synthase n=1 Tax=Kutzneria sp. CA-103260 TaxID=2802641 RepID=UPI001BA720CF|nr:type I polyketide synthase [Kutzneria sp. CA-103260]QUQ65431.1 3-ketoacyl-CoA thiolase [Kutzneria sp. CA-103260]